MAMNLTVSGKQLDIGESLRAHVERALTAAVAKYFDGAIEGAVTFSRHGHAFRADISVHVGRNIMVQGHETADDPYVAFDAACDHAAKRLRRHKRRLRDHNTRLGREVEETRARQSVIAVDDAAGDSPGHESLVIAEMQTTVPTLTVGEAVMHLDLGQLPALMFRNRANGLFNMVYRRPDGNIGWVDPQNSPPATDSARRAAAPGVTS